MNWFQKISSSGLMVAYHATIAGSQIVQQGFKTRDEMSGRAALGGGVSNALSFTTDWAVAKGVHDGFILAWQIANAPNGFEFIRNHFYGLAPEYQASVKRMLGAVQGGAVESNLEKFLNGFTIESIFGFGSGLKKPLTTEQLESMGYQAIDAPDNNIHYSWFRPMTDKERNDFLYGYLKAFHAGGGVYDPVFFGSDISNFRGINKADIGIISAEIEIDPEKRGIDDFPRDSQDITHRYVSSMAEIRVYPKAIKRILDFDNNPGQRPKFTGQQHYYSDIPKSEESINGLLSFIYKNYRQLSAFLLERDIAIDQFISLLQINDDKYKLAQLLATVKERIAGSSRNFKYFNNVISDFITSKKKIDIPANIQNYLSRLPQDEAQQILSGEKSSEVLYQLYENNKVAYNAWYDSFDDPDFCYKAESELEDWTYDRKNFLRQYEVYGKQYEREVLEFCKGSSPEFVQKFLQAIGEFESKYASSQNWFKKIFAANDAVNKQAIHRIKTAKPIQITDSMNEFAENVMATLLGNEIGRNFPRKLGYGEVIYIGYIEAYGKEHYIDVILRDPAESSGQQGDAETPAWRKAGPNESQSCNIQLFLPWPLPKGTYLPHIKQTILHEMIHCIDPKLNKSDVLETSWSKKHRQNMNREDYIQSPDYHTAPWEQDAFMSSRAYELVSMLKRAPVPYVRLVEMLRHHKPDPGNKFEQTYYENPKLWRRYMNAIWQSVQQIYKDDIPKNRRERGIAEQLSESTPNPSSSNIYQTHAKQDSWCKILKPAQVNSISLITSLIPAMISQIQTEYNAWDQSDPEFGDPDLGFGGICQNFAEIIADTLNSNGFEAATVSNNGMGEQHVYAIVKMPDGVYDVDIPYCVYETGGGYNWKKKQGVQFSIDDFYISKISPDPNDFEEMVADY